MEEKKIETTRKAREKKSALVQECQVGNGWIDISDPLEDTASALKWLKENGEDKKTYRIVTVQSEGVFSRTPVTTEKVSFG